MRKMLMLLALTLIATSASAIVDPTPDLMGFFFDENADSPCIEGVAPYSQLPMYLVITNMTADALYGFEAGYTIDGPATIMSTEYANPTVIDIGVAGNHIVGYGTPTPTTQVTLLATLNVMYMSTSDEPVYFSIHGSTPSSLDPLYPVILLADSQMQSVPVSGYFSGVSSVLNGTCVMSTDEVSFDEMKSLYR